ncbi:bifunctional adenosylcobinamide kinase/adenosylcobinamide-phosphate guanylyltransferase [Halocella sp. SP3-1]|nr:bifunctional adenosylcobinamide kinase/adenosylcobinamide-phosphate guanylyltransferase [Halocella sp. SP3-1]
MGKGGVGVITLVLGGARSGKSTFAEKIAYQKGRDMVSYLATAEAVDQEMSKRIKKHQESRPKTWQTIEEAYKLQDVFLSFPPGQVVLLDCLTIYISNILLKGNDNPSCHEEAIIVEELEGVINITREKNIDLIIVSNELGSGVVPVSKLGREFRDIAGRINQLIASEADEVYLCIAGLPVEIKEIGMRNLNKFKIQGDELI